MSLKIARDINDRLSSADRFSAFNSQHNYFNRIGIHQPVVAIERPQYVKPLRILPVMTLAESRLYSIEPDDNQYHKQFFDEMPDFLSSYFVNQYQKLHSKKGRRSANTFLRKTLSDSVLPRLKKVTDQYKPSLATGGFLPFPFHRVLEKLPTFDRQKIRTLSHSVAAYIHESFNHYTVLAKNVSGDNDRILKSIYEQTARLLFPFNITPPYWRIFTSKHQELTESHILSACARMTSPEWWRGQLKRRRDQQREHLAIAVGQVQLRASPYVSRSTLGEWKEQKKRNLEFFKSHDLENESGERASLYDMVFKSTANPAKRRAELMTRMSGFEDLADKLGYAGEFYTITAPSKYHAVYSKGGFIKKWNGSNPRETQQYLCKVWARIRAALKRAEIGMFGFRVVEPHHDGTPHWHLLMFMKPEHVDYVRDVICEYARMEDSEELQTQEELQARFHVVPIDKEKGRATGYIAKYISKNIDGFALDNEKDDETGQDLKTMSASITAWASRWRIRQFQQIGGAPVTVWRELRRLESGISLDSEHVDAVLTAADSGNWAGYIEAQGGAFVKRADLVVRLNYEIEKESNLYAEDVRRVKGIFSPYLSKNGIRETRLIKWVIVPKSAAQVDDGPLNRPIGAAWSSVNNCTQSENEQNRVLRERRRRGLEFFIKERKETLSEYQIEEVLNNSTADFTILGKSRGLRPSR